MSKAYVQWLEQGQRDFEVAQLLIQEGSLSHAAFFLEQAVEKTLKARLIWLGEGLRHTHQCGELALAADLPRNLVEKASTFSTYYVATRYPDTEMEEITDEDIDWLTTNAEKILVWIEKSLEN